MKRGPRIELPDKRGDELPVRSLVAVSIACMAAGLSVAYAVSDRHRRDARDEQRVAHEPAASTASGEAPEAAGPPVAVGAEPAIVPPPVAQTTVAAPPEPQPEPPEPQPIAQAPEPTLVEPDTAFVGPPVAETAPPTSFRPKIAPGTFAYLRCEGLPQRRGPFPCPRDRGLETRMREIIETLPTCRAADAIVRGVYDVRLELGPTGEVQDLAVRAPNEPAEHAVRACAAPQLRRERTELKPTRMIVSMRFKAR